MKGNIHMLGYYNYTVVLTYIGMLSGFAGMTFAVQGNIHNSLICLLASGICDMFDGKIASTMERTAQEKRFGIQIDSLSDMICFGVLPAIIVVVDCGINPFSFSAASMYVLCALIRLAWFNVDEEERQDREDCRRTCYLGLPVTLAAVFVPAAVWLTESCGWQGLKVYPAVLYVMAAAFIIPFRIRKPSFPQIGIALCGAAGLILLALSGMDA